MFNFGIIYALISAVCLAMSVITMRLTTKGETLYTFLLYYFAIGALASLPFAIFDWKVGNWVTLIGLISIGLCSFLGQICLFYGLKFGKASQLAPLTYSVVLFAGLYEWLIFGKIPPPFAFLGMFLIVAAGVWIVIVSPPEKK
jgi:drug/metabolite transporter (DMT)-like permease